MKAKLHKWTGFLLVIALCLSLVYGLVQLDTFKVSAAEESADMNKYNAEIDREWITYPNSDPSGISEEASGWTIGGGVNTYFDSVLNVQQGVSIRFDTAEMAFGKRLRFTFQSQREYIDFDKVNCIRIDFWLLENADFGGIALCSEIYFSEVEVGQPAATPLRMITNLTGVARKENGTQNSTEHVFTIYKDNGKYYFLRDNQPFHAASNRGDATGYDKEHESLGFDPSEVGFNDAFLTEATLAVSSDPEAGKITSVRVSQMSRDKNWMVNGFEAAAMDQGFVNLKQTVSSVGNALYQYPLDMNKRLQLSMRINNYPTSSATENDDGRNYLLIMLSKDKEFRDINTSVYSVALYQSAILPGNEGNGVVCLKSSVGSYYAPMSQFDPHTTPLKSPHNFDMGVNVKALGAEQSNLNAVEFNVNDQGTMSWFYNAAYANALGEWGNYGVAYKFGSSFLGDGNGYTVRPTYDHVVDAVTTKDFPEEKLYISVMAVSPNMTAERYWDVDLAVTQEGQMVAEGNDFTFEQDDAKDMRISLSTYHTQIDSVEIDGQTLFKDQDYSIDFIDTQRSILILKSAYLAGLQGGAHKITVKGTHLQPTGSYGFVPMNAPQQDKFIQRMQRMNALLPAGYKNVEEEGDWAAWAEKYKIVRDQALEIDFTAVSKSFTIIDTEKTFVKNSGSDVSIAIEANGNAGFMVSKGGTALAQSDFAVSDNAITVKNAYLDTLPSGMHEFTVTTSTDTVGKTFTVNVRDKASATNTSAEYETPGAGDLSFNFTLNGDVLQNVENLDAVNYTISDSSLTFKAAFLNTLREGAHTYTVQTELGAAIELTIRVTALKPFVLDQNSASYVLSGNEDISVAYTIHDDELREITLNGAAIPSQHFSFADNKITLRADYLNMLSAGEYTFRIVSKLGSADLQIAIRSKATIVDANKRYTLNGGGTVSFEFEMNGDVLTSVKEIEAGNYTIADGVLTFKNSYLDTLDEGTHTFTVQTELSAALTVTVEITKLDPIVLGAQAATFMKGSGTDVSVSYTDNDDIVNKVTLNGADVAVGNFTISDGKIIFKAEYLDALDGGDYSFKIVSDLAETVFKISVVEESGGCGSSIIAFGPIVCLAAITSAAIFILSKKKNKTL